MRRARTAVTQPLVDAADVGLEHLPDVRADKVQLRLGRTPEPKAPAHAVDGDGVAPDELRQRPGSHPQQQLELEGTVLGVAEAQAEPRVARGFGIDVRDAPAIAADRDGSPDAAHLDAGAHARQSPAQEQAKDDARPLDPGHVPQRTYTRPVSRTIELAAGLMLLLIGLLVLSAGWIGSWVGSMGVEGRWLAYWPLALIVLSLFFIGPALIGRTQHRRLRAGMAIPGALLLGAGAALLFSSLNDRWNAWSYLWTVIPFSFGIGMYAAGWIADAPAFKWIGSGVAAGSVIAYLALSTAFGGEAFRLVARE